MRYFLYKACDSNKTKPTHIPQVHMEHSQAKDYILGHKTSLKLKTNYIKHLFKSQWYKTRNQLEEETWKI